MIPDSWAIWILLAMASVNGYFFYLCFITGVLERFGRQAPTWRELAFLCIMAFGPMMYAGLLWMLSPTFSDPITAAATALLCGLGVTRIMRICARSGFGV